LNASKEEYIVDIQSALNIAKRLEGIERRSRNFGYSADDIREEILLMAEDLKKYADRLDQAMAQEMELL
jgi:hypothetical protein